MPKRATKKPAPPPVVVDDLGIVCTELHATHGAVRYAHVQATRLGHVALWQGTSCECSRCGQSGWLVAAHPKGWTFEGAVSSQVCS